MTEPLPINTEVVDAVLQKAAKDRKAHAVLEIDGWILWNWMDPPEDQWSIPFGMFHKCGIEQYHTVRCHGSGAYKCNRCAATPPDGIIAAYEFMNWEAMGYGC